MRVERETVATPSVAEAVEALLHAERAAWAMKIHDGLTQSVTSAILELQSLRKRIAADPATAVTDLKVIEDEIRKDLAEIRRVLFALQNGDASTDPEVGEPTLGRFIDDVVRRWGLHARVSVEGDMLGVSREVLETAHGIVAEAVANAAKHSGSPDVTVRVRAEGSNVRIEVEDRGRGISVTAGDTDTHFGLSMMRARAEDIGGTIDIDSTPGNGTRVVACLPVGGAR
jgi:two-component system nitrate/nitrite sensor histidine kinase NarX